MSEERLSPWQNRELSWLSFNERVLQEAQDPTVPIFERLKFLAIYSSNSDEFFRVRVASLRSLLRLKKKTTKALQFNPSKLLREIHRIVTAQQERFGEILRRQLIPQLEELGIRLINEQNVSASQAVFLRSYFEAEVRPHLELILLKDTSDQQAEHLFLKNQKIYLIVELWEKETHDLLQAGPTFALLNIPSPPLDRFISVPAEHGHQAVIFLDDVIRLHLGLLFPEMEVGFAYAVKLSRDADLYLEDEFSGDVVAKIRQSLRKRETGLPSRFLYDLQAPYALVAYLKQVFSLHDEDLVPGGRYHNLNDLMDFPRFGLTEHSDPNLPVLPHPPFNQASSMFEAIRAKDQMLHFPYQSYDYVVQFLEQAANDPSVQEIWITLYRVARDSSIVQALIKAARKGIQVTAFVEVKARFDEAQNLHWADQMEAAGVRTCYSMPHLKVHAKLALVGRGEEEGLRYYAYLSTGNFNEKTAALYTDLGLFTADPRLAEEVRQVFGYLVGEMPDPVFEHLLVAPFEMRQAFYDLIAYEQTQAMAGAPSGITLKMNSLEDPEIIKRLYEASQAGVPMRLLIRGICCLVPGVHGWSETIEARSIVDRFLEHARVYQFHDNGKQKVFVASADWMTRNLSRRVEVAFPLYDPEVKQQVVEMLEMQWADNTKARLLDAAQSNTYAERAGDNLRAQKAWFEVLKELTEEATADLSA